MTKFTNEQVRETKIMKGSEPAIVLTSWLKYINNESLLELNVETIIDGLYDNNDYFILGDYIDILATITLNQFPATAKYTFNDIQNLYNWLLSDDSIAAKNSALFSYNDNSTIIYAILKTIRNIHLNDNEWDFAILSTFLESIINMNNLNNINIDNSKEFIEETRKLICGSENNKTIHINNIVNMFENELKIG